MITTIIGVDCSANERNVGLALSHVERLPVDIEVVETCSKKRSAAEIIADWIVQSKNSPTLLALDAPLGWPRSLAEALHLHQAGESIPGGVEPDRMFRRCTDNVVADKVKKRSLDVGADHIARTAHAALALLEDLRKRTDQDIPLAWKPKAVSGICAIEVYPAATLRVHGLPDTGYKKKEHDQERRYILNQLTKKGIQLSSESRRMCMVHVDALDAVICVLAGVDFLQGEAVAPRDDQLEAAKKEGWIWVRDPGRYRETAAGSLSGSGATSSLSTIGIRPW